MGSMIMKVEGLDGSIDLLSDRVVIHHDGLWNALKFGFNATREIPLGAILEIGFKNSNALMMGEIEFIVGGKQTIQIGKKKPVNHNAVKFKRKQQKEFEILKEKVFELMMQQNQRRQS